MCVRLSVRVCCAKMLVRLTISASMLFFLHTALGLVILVVALGDTGLMFQGTAISFLSAHT